MTAHLEVTEPGRPPRLLALEPGPLEVGRECDGLVVEDAAADPLRPV